MKCPGHTVKKIWIWTKIICAGLAIASLMIVTAIVTFTPDLIRKMLGKPVLSSVEKCLRRKK